MFKIKKSVVAGQKYLYIGNLHIPYHTKQNGTSKRLCIGTVEIPYHFSPVFGIPLPFNGKINNAKEQHMKRVHYRCRAHWDNLELVQCRLEQLYEQKVGKKINLDAPETFTEKLNWLKIHYHQPLLTTCCDKYTVKNYISNILGKEYHVPTIQAWASAKDIDFQNLPKSFVLKVNWSSGYNIMVQDQTKLRICEKKRIIKHLDYWMQPMCNSYYDSFNWGYKNCVPVVYAEEYLGEDFIAEEYKIFCFHGRAQFILVEKNIPPYQGARICVDPNGQPLPFQIGQHERLQEYHPPTDLLHLLTLSEQLAKPFPFVRIDFLGTPKRRLVGEMTFYSGGGFSQIFPEIWDQKLGTLLRLEQPWKENNEVSL